MVVLSSWVNIIIFSLCVSPLSLSLSLSLPLSLFVSHSRTSDNITKQRKEKLQEVETSWRSNTYVDTVDVTGSLLVNWQNVGETRGNLDRRRWEDQPARSSPVGIKPTESRRLQLRRDEGRKDKETMGHWRSGDVAGIQREEKEQ